LVRYDVIPNARWRTAAVLKIENTQKLGRGSSVLFFYLTGYKPKCQLAFVANINVTLLANLLKQLLVVDMKRVTKLKEDTGFLTVSISMSCCMWKKHLAFWGHDPLGTINPPSLFPFRSFYFPFPSYPFSPPLWQSVKISSRNSSTAKIGEKVQH